MVFSFRAICRTSLRIALACTRTVAGGLQPGLCQRAVPVAEARGEGEWIELAVPAVGGLGERAGFLEAGDACQVVEQLLIGHIAMIRLQVELGRWRRSVGGRRWLVLVWHLEVRGEAGKNISPLYLRRIYDPRGLILERKSRNRPAIKNFRNFGFLREYRAARPLVTALRPVVIGFSEGSSRAGRE